MAHLIQSIIDGYYDIIEKQSDPRVSDWFLMSSPFPTIGICIAYVIGVKIIGPKLMKNRKAYDLRNTIMIYNVFQIIYNLRLLMWGFHKGGPCNTLKVFQCNYIDHSPAGTPCASLFWYFYILKLTELSDTVFFVLRKKNKQVSTLHVIHHGIMPLFLWIVVKFVPGGATSFGGYLNTLVHVVMYAYYILAAMGPQMQKYLWWKKYLTTMQIGQFIMVLIYTTLHFLVLKCSYPRVVFLIPGSLGLMFLYMFANFYKQAYIVKKSHAVYKVKNCDDIKSTKNVFSEFNHAERVPHLKNK